MQWSSDDQFGACESCAHCLLALRPTLKLRDSNKQPTPAANDAQLGTNMAFEVIPAHAEGCRRLVDSQGDAGNLAWLQPSEMGRPVYGSMGFRAIAEWQVWIRRRPRT